MMTYPGRCRAIVFKRDQYRVNRGHGFRMHYTSDQCSRTKLVNRYFCWQHKGHTYNDSDTPNWAKK